jgi:hypothetical protein
VASGDLAHNNGDLTTASGALPMGTVITSSGRVSAARFPGDAPTTPPFSRDDLVALDDALKESSEVAQVRFSVFIGDLGADAVSDAKAILGKAPEPYNGALIAVSPNTKDVVVVSGKDVADRVNDRVAQLGVSAAITSIRQGNLIDGLVAALHVMATAAAAS